MIRCIQIGGPNGPIAQGPAIIATLRNHQTGEPEPTGYATVTDGATEYAGRLVDSIRRAGCEC